VQTYDELRRAAKRARKPERIAELSEAADRALTAERRALTDTGVPSDEAWDLVYYRVPAGFMDGWRAVLPVLTAVIADVLDAAEVGPYLVSLKVNPYGWIAMRKSLPRSITFSPIYPVERHGAESLVHIALHEAAHAILAEDVFDMALADDNANHGPRFEATARTLGCAGDVACNGSNRTLTPEAYARYAEALALLDESISANQVSR
jgi:hypothetical protein